MHLDFLTCTLAARAAIAPGGAWLELLQFATLATTLYSGAEYVLVWGRKAIADRGSTHGTRRI